MRNTARLLRVEFPYGKHRTENLRHILNLAIVLARVKFLTSSFTYGKEDQRASGGYFEDALSSSRA